MNPNILNEVLCRAADLGWWPVQEQGVCGCKGLEAMSRMNLDRSQPQNLQPELLLMKARSESHGARTQRRPALADWLQLFDLRIFLCSSEKELQSAPENHQLLCGIDQPSTTSSQICLKLQALPWVKDLLDEHWAKNVQREKPSWLHCHSPIGLNFLVHWFVAGTAVC